MTEHASTQSHPVAHLVLADPACRETVVDTLQRSGWSIVEHSTGLHMIEAISGLILNDEPSHRADLIVADAAARGCSGLSIARGLSDLGSRIPVIVVARAADELASAHHGLVTIVKRDDAARAVARIAHRGFSHRGPCALSNPTYLKNQRRFPCDVSKPC